VPTHPRQILDEDFPVAGYFSNSSGIVQPIELLSRDKPLLIEPKHSILVNESNAHLACALAGLGLVHTLDFMVRPSIERGELIVVLPEYRPKPLDVFVVYPPSRQLSTKVRVFVEWVTQIYDRLGPP
jgi:DNA-binding transcriptional LysR family regulator